MPGKHAKRDREKQPEFPNAAVNHAEWQQAERTGIDPAERKDQITALKQASDSPQAFMRALEEQGYLLAKGERRDFVLVDPAGEVYSLARQIHGMKAAELREYMKGLNPENLPTVDQAAELQQQMQDMKKQPAEKPAAEKPAPEKQTETVQPEPAQPAEQAKGLSPEEIQAIQKAVADRQVREAADMRQRQSNEYNHTRDIFDREMAEKLADRDAMQKAERARFARENAPATGVDQLIDRFQRWWNPKLVQEREADRERRQQEMENRQTKERADYAAKLKQARDIDLGNLSERHAQQLRDHGLRTKEDLERYIRQQETARRLAEMRERERQQERKRTRDGPEWPAGPQISRFVKDTAALMPPMPEAFSSRFLAKPTAPPVETVTTPSKERSSRFLPRKMLSRFIHQVEQTRPQIITRFLKGIAALIPSIPTLFSSRFFSKPRAPPRHLRPHWPSGKPRDHGR